MEQKYESLAEVVGGVLREALREAARPAALEEADQVRPEAFDDHAEASQNYALH